MIARSLIGKGFIVDGIPRQELPPVPAGVAMRYPVMLYKLHNKNVTPFGEFFLGHIVTELPLDEWCRQNGYALGELYLGTRPARADERTDLF